MRHISTTHFYGSLSIKQYELSNGLQVLLLPEDGAPVVAYQTWFKVGSRNEKIGKSGIAHLFEHLMFNETKRLPAGTFDRTIEAAGGHTNAATWVDWTYYQNDIPSSKLELLVNLESQRMNELIVKLPQLTSEREVVLNERRFRVEDDIDGFLSEKLYELAFTTHPYRFPTIGSVDDICSITLEDTDEFYKTYYAPNNAIIVLAGNFSTDKALEWIETYYGILPSQPIPTFHGAKEPPQIAEKRNRYEKPVLSPKVIWGYKSPALSHPHHLSLDMLGDFLFGGPSSPIYSKLVLEKEIVSSLHYTLTPFANPGLFEISATIKPGYSIEEVESLLRKEIDDFKERLISSQELDKTKARFLTGFYKGLRTANQKATAIGHYFSILGDVTPLTQLPTLLKEVTPSQLQELAAHYLNPSQCSSVVALPLSTKEEILV